jgi:hypothetical protein
MSLLKKKAPALSRGKKIVFFGVLLVLSGVAALLAAEVVLRLVPIPGISYHSFYFDRVTGGHYYPNSTLTYQNARGDYVERSVNAWGYPDIEHEIEKPPRTFRIGFFGDSYTEAIQVPLVETFFSLIENDINSRLTTAHSSRRPVDRIEAICFGVSGRSTLQSYLECERWMDRVDLDEVVYVFVENDPSDQIQSLKKSDEIPFAYLEADSFVIDFSFRERYGHKESRLHRIFQYLKANSLVISTLESRLKLLKRHGIRMAVTEADMNMEADPAAERGRVVPTSPSTWPDSLHAYGEELLARIITRWHSDVIAAGREFTVAYVPKAEQMARPMEAQDSWLAWLTGFCSERGISLVDPTVELKRRQDAGEEVFYDHFTASGHRAFADAYIHYDADREAAAERNDSAGE